MSETYDHESGNLEILSSPLATIHQEIDIQIATSKRFPRRKDQQVALAIMSRATLNADIAAECIYNLPRDGKTIAGPSIRFAEIVRSCYGNIRVASRFVRIDADDKSRQAVICEAIAYDTEGNDSELSQVRRSIMTSAKGNNVPRPYSVDMIATTVMAAQSICRRNAILSLVPKAVWIDGYGEVERVVRGDAATLNDRRAKMLVEFGKFDITPAQLFSALGIDSEHEIGLNDMPTLAGMWSALRDGEAAESVLGMIAQTRSRPKPAIENPMANRPMTIEAPMRGAAMEEARADKGHAEAEIDAAVASEEVEQQKRKRRTKAEMEAARAAEQRPAGPEPHPEMKPGPAQNERPRDLSDPGEMPDFLKRKPTAAAPEKAPETKSEPAPATDFASCIAYIKAFTGTAGALMDWWRSVKDLRKGFSFDESGEISKLYNAKFSDLNKEE